MAGKGKLIGHDVRVRWQDRWVLLPARRRLGIIGRRQMIHWSRDKNERDIQPEQQACGVGGRAPAANQASFASAWGNPRRSAEAGGGEAAPAPLPALASHWCFDTTLPDPGRPLGGAPHPCPGKSRASVPIFWLYADRLPVPATDDEAWRGASWRAATITLPSPSRKSFSWQGEGHAAHYHHA